jgi:hypothetical protein
VPLLNRQGYITWDFFVREPAQFQKSLEGDKRPTRVVMPTLARVHKKQGQRLTKFSKKVEDFIYHCYSHKRVKIYSGYIDFSTDA